MPANLKLKMHLDIREWKEYSKRVLAKVGNLMPLWHFSEPVIRNSIQANFRMGGRPTPWPRLKPSTIAQRSTSKPPTWPSTMGSGILVRTGNLMQKAITPEVLIKTNKMMIWGLRDKRARLMQEGGMVRFPAMRKTHGVFKIPISPSEVLFRKSVRAHTAKIPPRPFLLFQKVDVKMIAQFCLNYAFGDK